MNVKVCPKKPRSQQFSGFSSEMGVANSVVCMPRNVDPSVKKGVGLKQLTYSML